MPGWILKVKIECCFVGKSEQAPLISPSFRTAPTMKLHHVQILKMLIYYTLVLLNQQGCNSYSNPNSFFSMSYKMTLQLTTKTVISKHVY